jgi:hypothetical protein
MPLESFVASVFHHAACFMLHSHVLHSAQVFDIALLHVVLVWHDFTDSYGCIFPGKPRWYNPEYGWATTQQHSHGFAQTTGQSAWYKPRVCG